ncbi:ATPase [Helicobacter didelphidarum]|uniref:ATPase n=1 Tax=Helicobacter didelphidarum TaxID=2040648 RepID=A0A3D8ILH9_9HELI|nr:ABC transporter ATP-binding protein [Helicobacter didelphidarum]RDU65973.1 ATPase [Helicobacter didelphidarum]
MKHVVIAKNLTKNFERKKVLDNINLSVRENEIFGIIGPDGAGKSTLFRIFTTLLLGDSGECEVAGYNVVQDFAKIREIVGYMPGNFSLYMDLSVEENLQFFASIFNTSIEENYDLIKQIYRALEPFKNRKAGALSGGMKQKLALCCALIHKPKVLFLDEPTTGVDAVSRMEFWEILGELKSQMSVIVSTPYMDEASLCDRVALIFDGRILSLDTPKNLCESFPHTLYEFRGIPASALDSLRELAGVHSCFLFGNCYHIVFKNLRQSQKHNDTNIAENITQDSIKNILENFDFPNMSYKEIGASIEDCFMEFLQ